MAYLTFVNCYHSDSIAKALGLGGVLIKGHYDVLIPSIDVNVVLEELSMFPSSSITLKSHKELELRKYNILTIQNKNIDLDGCYDSIYTSNKVEVLDVIDEPHVKGYLPFELDSEEILEIRKESVIMRGKNYIGPATRRNASESDIKQYHSAAKKLHDVVQEFRPTLLYAPARGAHPILKSILRNNQGSALKTYFPVTSSFVFGGRYNHKLEVSKLEGLLRGNKEKLLYVEEVVSGGMMKGHLKELNKGLIDLLFEGDLEIMTAGIVHDAGNKLNSFLLKEFEALKEANQLFLEYVDNLFTLDDNEYLGLHYLDYSFGPHLVPYLPEGEKHTKSNVL